MRNTKCSSTSFLSPKSSDRDLRLGGICRIARRQLLVTPTLLHLDKWSRVLVLLGGSPLKILWSLCCKLTTLSTAIDTGNSHYQLCHQWKKHIIWIQCCHLSMQEMNTRVLCVFSLIWESFHILSWMNTMFTEVFLTAFIVLYYQVNYRSKRELLFEINQKKKNDIQKK